LPSSTPTVTVDARLLSYSGIGTYLRQLLPRVVAANPALQFNVLLQRDSQTDGFLDGAPNARLEPCPVGVFTLAEQFLLPGRLPQDTDLLWVPHYVLPVAYRGKLLVTVHDLCHLALPNRYLGAHKRLYSRAMFEVVRRRADHILVVSEFTRKEFRRLLGEPRGKLEVVNIGVDESWFTDDFLDSAELVAQPFFVYVGNVKPHKNLSTLLAAFERVRADIPHDLLIVGVSDGLRTGDPEALATARQMKGRVHLVGYLEERQLKAHVSRATALVFPSLYEGFGLPPLEAMAIGCPVISSNAASMPEVCGNAVRYFDPLDVEALSGELLRAAAAPAGEDVLASGRSRARMFNWTATAESTSRAILDLLKG
jgi:glycosyltransferase involved in cell wall biosynthesis